MGSLPSGAGALIGKRLGNYQLVALLALGGTAEIYLARIDGAAGFEKYVVVKCLHDHLADNREFVQMFLDEARLGALLGHSNIVHTLALGEQDGRYYLVMEHISGMSLSQMARRAGERVPGGLIPVPLVLGAMIQACAGLHYAHDCSHRGRPLNLIHRDVSPQNLVVTFEGVVKIVDFGIAKAEDRETATKSGTIKGKFAYMSPEQCRARDVDRRTDVFALGVILHELITGRRLFKRSSAYETYQAILACKVPAPSSVRPTLDPALDPIVLKALTKNPSQRYPSAEAFGDALSHYLHSRGHDSGARDIARFIEQYYGPEIDDSGARMRELLAGRPAAALGWNEPEEVLSASVVELSQLDLVDDESDVNGGAPLDPPGRVVRDPDTVDTGLETGIDTSVDRSTDDDELPAEATRIELNPTAQLAALDAVVRQTQPPPSGVRRPTEPPSGVRRPTEPPPPPLTADAPTQAKARPRPPSSPPPERLATPQFGKVSPGGSMFGGPPGGLKAPPLPEAPEPAHKHLPSIFGGPSKVAPNPAPSPAPRARSPSPPPRAFSEAPFLPTMLAEPEPPPPVRAKGFVAASEAATMAMDDGGQLAGALADLRAAEAQARRDDRERTPLLEPVTPLAARLAATVVAEHPDERAALPVTVILDPPGGDGRADGLPAASLRLTPDRMLPAHLIGLPPIESFPQPWPPRRGLPSWVLPVVVGSVLAVLVGVIAALAT